MNINYIFHIGERCQHLAFLKKSNLLSGFNCFSGIYISFESALKLIKTDCMELKNNVVKFVISKKDDGIQFIRCNNFSEEEILHIETLVKNNFFNFFNSVNFYKDADYCINLKYTDLSNFKENDIYDWSNHFCIMPNSDYSDEVFLKTFYRRTTRFVSCLNENLHNILLIYMNKSILDTTCKEKIVQISTLYDLPYNLFYILPVYYKDLNEPILSELTISIKNITFFIIYFPSNDIQKQNNPNDDNNLSYVEQYDKIKNALLKTYNIDLKTLY